MPHETVAAIIILGFAFGTFAGVLARAKHHSHS
jgi:hypothetical protein